MNSLLLDVGNTRVKWARVRAGLYEFCGSLPLAGLSVDVFLAQVWPEADRPALVVMSAVGDGDWARSLRFAMASQWQARVIEVVAEEQRDGLVNGYAQPQRLGSDRWCALLGAWQGQPEPVCVVDAGTALTMDVVNSGGEHLGGLIVPGLRMMQSSLQSGTARVAAGMSDADEHRPGGLLGRTTSQAVAGGALWTLAAGVERLRAQGEDLVGGHMRGVITGGDAQQLLPLLSGDWVWVPDLVLQGLRRYLSDA